MKLSLSKVTGLILLISIVAYSCKKDEEVTPQVETIIEEVVSETPSDTTITNNTNPIDTSLISAIDTTAINQIIDSVNTGTVTVDTISYAQTIAPIITNNCDGSGCYGTISSRDYMSHSKLNTVAINGKLNTRVVVNQSMPVGGPLTSTEIENIDNWIKQGALDN
jgi:hypothetical protein